MIMAKSKEQEIPEGYKQTEIGVIPIDWDIMRLGEAVDVVGGGTPSTANPKYWNGSINWFTPTEVGNEKYVYESKRKISDEGLKNSSAKILNEGTVLLTSRAGIGDLAILKARACTNQGFQSLVPKDQTDGEFLYYLMLTKKSDLLDKASGSTFLEISPNNVRNILIQLPKTSEQTVIAAVLSDTDELIEKLNKLIEKKKNIKQGAMQELLAGERRLSGFTGKWNLSKLGKECELVTKGTTPTSLGRAFKHSGITFVKVESISENGTFLADMVSYIDEDTHNLLNRSQLKENDILISIAGALGRAAIVKRWMLPANTNQALAIVRLKNESNLLPQYIFYYLKTEKIKKHIYAISVQGAQPNLSLKNIFDFPIEYPGKSEQRAIVQVLYSMDSEIEELESELIKYKNIKQGMMQNLLTGKIRLIKK